MHAIVHTLPIIAFLGLFVYVTLYQESTPNYNPYELPTKEQEVIRQMALGAPEYTEE